MHIPLSVWASGVGPDCAQGLEGCLLLYGQVKNGWYVVLYLLFYVTLAWVLLKG